jgi:hypothetical protein
MKFGKLCEEAFRKLEIDLPAFPYKQAKKELKAAALQPCGLAARVVFFNFLRKELMLIDDKWSCAARQTVQAKVAPITTRFLTTVGLRRRPGAEAARKLNAWASLSRDGVRKTRHAAPVCPLSAAHRTGDPRAAGGGHGGRELYCN